MTDEDVRLSFDSSTGDSTTLDMTSTGSAPVITTVVTLNGGQAQAVVSRAGQGLAARFPTFDATQQGARAMVRIQNASSRDLLEPGLHPLTWGAEFRIDAASVSKESGSADNGNNLVQRGLAGSGHQFKLEVDGVDGRQPACRVETANGSVRVVVPVQLDSGYWYRASCQRSGETLTGTVFRLDGKGQVVQTWSRTATFTGAVPLGGIYYGDPTLPVSVGGKLTRQGSPQVTASDQFNGVVDNVVIDVIR